MSDIRIPNDNRRIDRPPAYISLSSRRRARIWPLSRVGVGGGNLGLTRYNGPKSGHLTEASGKRLWGLGVIEVGSVGIGGLERLLGVAMRGLGGCGNVGGSHSRFAVGNRNPESDSMHTPHYRAHPLNALPEPLSMLTAEAARPIHKKRPLIHTG